MEKQFEIIRGDAAEKLTGIGSETVDIVVTSPPYDSLRNYNGFDFSIGKCETIVKELFRVLKNGGVVVWIVADQVVDGSETGTSFEQALLFKQVGFRIHDTMIWKKTNPMPRVKTKRYFDCFEYMFVFSKGQPKTFNPILVECKFGGKVYNSTCRNMGGENGRTHKTFVLNNTRYKDNVWQCAVAQNKSCHSAVFPLSLAEDHIKTWSNEDDLVLDPFVGSGTTGEASIKNNRRFIGIDISEEFCLLSEKRIAEAVSKKASESRQLTLPF